MDPVHLKKIENVIKNANSRHSDFWKNKKRLELLRKKAYENAVKKHGKISANRRRILAGDILKFRGLDVNGVWGRSFKYVLTEFVFNFLNRQLKPLYYI
jgi:hypothetical protein